MPPGMIAGLWYLLCLLMLAGPMRKMQRYREVSRAALLMAVPWTIIVAAALGERGESMLLDFILAAAGLPVAWIVFWEWGLVFLLLPLSIIHFLGTSAPLVKYGDFLATQFEMSFRENVRMAATIGACTYGCWMLWVVLAARLEQ